MIRNNENKLERLAKVAKVPYVIMSGIIAIATPVMAYAAANSNPEAFNTAYVVGTMSLAIASVWALNHTFRNSARNVFNNKLRMKKSEYSDYQI